MGIYKFDPEPEPHFQFLCEHGARAPDTVHIFILIMPVSSSNAMFDHLLKLSQ